MAKKKRYNVSGKSTKELLDISVADIMKMSERELKDITSRLVSSSNKRIRNLEKSSTPSPALERLKTDVERGTRKDPRFTVKDKNLNETREEYYRIKNFFNDSTSNVKGAKSNISEIAKMMNTTAKNVSENWKKIWETIDKARELDPNSRIDKIQCENMFKEVGQVLEEQVPLDEVLNRVQENIKTSYEQRQRAMREEQSNRWGTFR